MKSPIGRTGFRDRQIAVLMTELQSTRQAFVDGKMATEKAESLATKLKRDTIAQLEEQVDRFSDSLVTMKDDRDRLATENETLRALTERQEKDTDHQNVTIDTLQGAVKEGVRQVTEANDARYAVEDGYRRLFHELGKRWATIELEHLPQAMTHQTSYLVAFRPALKDLAGTAYGERQSRSSIEKDVSVLEQLTNRFPLSDKWVLTVGGWDVTTKERTVYLVRPFENFTADTIESMDAAQAELQGHLTRYLQVKAYGSIAGAEESEKHGD